MLATSPRGSSPTFNTHKTSSQVVLERQVKGEKMKEPIEKEEEKEEAF